MKLKTIASNMTELNFNGVSVLFSYETPVAGWDDKGAFRTETNYSRTTSKHINKYLGGNGIGRKVSQEYINALTSEQTVIHSKEYA
tara:strand:+ start:795 stop:1052 length:258 start_codon:yes stop_codon:yes gene_type:complete